MTNTIKYLKDENGNIISPVTSVDSIFDSQGGGIKAYLLNAIYPIGSIYISTSSTSPATLFGGTWERWGNGRVPVSVNENDADFNTVEKTGGAKTTSISASNLPAHTHTYNQANSTSGSTKLGVEHIPPHTHSMKFVVRLQQSTDAYIGAIVDGARTDQSGTLSTVATGGGQGHTHSISTTSTNTGSTGSGTAINIQQQYITCYMWKRTA